LLALCLLKISSMSSSLSNSPQQTEVNYQISRQCPNSQWRKGCTTYSLSLVPHLLHIPNHRNAVQIANLICNTITLAKVIPNSSATIPLIPSTVMISFHLRKSLRQAVLHGVKLSYLPLVCKITNCTPVDFPLGFLGRLSVSFIDIVQEPSFWPPSHIVKGETTTWLNLFFSLWQDELCPTGIRPYCPNTTPEEIADFNGAIRGVKGRMGCWRTYSNALVHRKITQVRSLTRCVTCCSVVVLEAVKFVFLRNSWCMGVEGMMGTVVLIKKLIFLWAKPRMSWIQFYIERI
jgi:hypothetical protein